MRITSIEDVGNDQGRQVRVAWDAALHDAAGTEHTVTSYTLLRRIDQYLPYPPGRWDIVKTVPAWGEANYNTICPTLCDSTVAEGMCMSHFFVRANTEAPPICFDSKPDSGYSVDNLAPEAPRNLRWDYPSALLWDEAAEEDFDYFAIYASDSEQLDEHAALLGYTTGTALDLADEELVYLYYFVTATDFSGNEGEPATLQAPAGVGGSDAIPLAYAMRPARPNPFVGATVLSFDLPAACATNLAVYDAGGRLVRVLVDQTLPAGCHRITRDSVSENGNAVPPGIYFGRLHAGGFKAIERLVILK
jgi:hypothetical protein